MGNGWEVGLVGCRGVWGCARVDGAACVMLGRVVGARVVGVAGGEGSLKTGVEDGRGSCHLAAGTLECHNAGLTVCRWRHRHDHLQEFLKGGAVCAVASLPAEPRSLLPRAARP